MKSRAAWVTVLAARSTLASLLRSERHRAKLAPKAEIRQWEDEGGSLARPLESEGEAPRDDVAGRTAR